VDGTAHPRRPMVGVGAIVVDEQRRLLVVRRRDPPAAGRWTVPGGRLEVGERIRDAIAREVREETGLSVEVGALAGVAEHITDTHHVVIVDHHGTVTGGELRAGDDAAEVRWMDRAELEAVPTTDGLFAFLARAGVQLRG
jgi:8-oxo-dGTP diphosphatase